ncbi:MAG: cation:proton antiporter [Planctomycetota bacterium]
MTNALRLFLILLVLLGFAYAGQQWAYSTALEEDVPSASQVEDAGPLVDLLGKPFAPTPNALIDTGAGVGLLLLGAWISGLLIARVGLPQIVGYLLFGVICGPGLLDLINKEELGYLEIVKDLAIALIALTAGGEMRLDVLRKSLRGISLIAIIEMSAVGLGVGAFAAMVIPRLGIEGLEGTASVIALAAIIGTISVSNSPAILLAIITESKSKGTMTQTSLAVTILKDLLLVILFTIVLAIAGSALATADGGGATWYGPVKKIGGSIALGTVAGLAMAWYIHRVNKHMAIFVVMACLLLALTAKAMGLETLIVAVVAGMLMENVWGERAEGLFETIEDLSMPVFCVFFAWTGAKVELDAVAQMWPWALAIIGVRGVLVWSSTGLGAKLAGIEQPARRWLWTAFVPQAGVSLALAAIFQETFGDQPFVEAVFALLLAIIALQKLIAPALLNFGLARAGEAGQQNVASEPETDAAPPALRE